MKKNIIKLLQLANILKFRQKLKLEARKKKWRKIVKKNSLKNGRLRLISG